MGVRTQSDRKCLNNLEINGFGGWRKTKDFQKASVKTNRVETESQQTKTLKAVKKDSKGFCEAYIETVFKTEAVVEKAIDSEDPQGFNETFYTKADSV